jgi:hypothetical protein
MRSATSEVFFRNSYAQRRHDRQLLRCPTWPCSSYLGEADWAVWRSIAAASTPMQLNCSRLVRRAGLGVEQEGRSETEMPSEISCDY